MPLLFSYGTLQREDVQLSTFGRRIPGRRDELVGFQRGTVVIDGAEEANVVFAGGDLRVGGVALEVSDDELARADEYELPYGYKRIATTLASGATAWVYVHVAS